MKKVVIIKLGALGDVIRTLPIAQALKERNPDCEIHWITKPNAVELFEGNPFVDKVFSIPFSTEEKYDALYNFDIEEEATELAQRISADKKFGFYSEEGFASAFNFPSEYYLNTLFDDKTKKDNKKTYQEMMFEVAEIPYNKEMPSIYLNEKEKNYSEEFVRSNSLDLRKKTIGIHMGASSRWPSKIWDREKVKDFIKKAVGKEYNVILFGGPNEIEEHKKLASELFEEEIKIYRNNPNNSIMEFSSLVNICNKMVCSDSFALHVALSLKKPTIGLFFCTSANEVEDYGLLKKVISPMQKDFFPEKMNLYDKELVNSISVEDVVSSLDK